MKCAHCGPVTFDPSWKHAPDQGFSCHVALLVTRVAKSRMKNTINSISRGHFVWHVLKACPKAFSSRHLMSCCVITVVLTTSFDWKWWSPGWKSSLSSTFCSNIIYVFTSWLKGAFDFCYAASETPEAANQVIVTAHLQFSRPFCHVSDLWLIILPY